MWPDMFFFFLKEIVYGCTASQETHFFAAVTRVFRTNRIIYVGQLNETDPWVRF